MFDDQGFKFATSDPEQVRAIVDYQRDPFSGGLIFDPVTNLPIPIYGTIWILLAAYVARFVPLATRSVNATFRQIDVSLEEAGRITGASWWVAVRRIL
jgi:ABC-type Fe3+ transport system permease subunit